jgi:MFS family permease
VGAHRRSARALGWDRPPRDLLIACAVMAGSTAGDMAAQAALTLRLHDQVGTGAAVSALLLANSVPVLLLAPVTGRLADRVDSRTLLVAAGLCCALLCLPLAGQPPGPALLALVAALAGCSAVISAALGALVPGLAGPSGVVAATTLLRGAIMVSGVAGLALGSAAAAVTGTAPILLADAGSSAALAAGAGLIRARRGGRGPRRPRERVARPARLMPWVLTGGYAAVLLLVSTTNVAQVFLLKDVLHAGDLGYGLVSACWTVGTLLALPVMRRVAEDPEILARVSTLGAALVGTAVLGCGAAGDAGATAALYVLGGAGTCVMQIARGSYLQLVAPPERRGRQLAGYNAVVKAASIGALGLGGLALARVQPGTVYLLAGAGALAVATTTGLLWTALTPHHPRRGRHHGLRPRECGVTLWRHLPLTRPEARLSR